MRKNIIIVDIDGTIADHSHRVHHVEKKPKNWGAFHKGMEEDPPNEWCVSLVKSLLLSGEHYPEYRVFFVTGRSDKYFTQTVRWLSKQGIPLYDGLFMRKENDHREDTVVKKEIIQNNFNVDEILFALEDRSRVVKMYRDLGITVLQCAEGDY